MRTCSSAIRMMMTADSVGGVWIYATMLARALGAAGFEVLLVTLGPAPSAAQKGDLLGHSNITLIETDLQLEWQDPAGSDMGRAEAVLGGIADRFGPDLVHLNSFREAAFHWAVPTVVIAHSCVNSWAEACGEADAFVGDDWKAYSLAVRAGLQNASEWVAPSRAFRDLVKVQYGLTRNGRVIWNGVEGGGYHGPGKQPFVLSAGRVWDKAKNLSALASIAAGLDWPVRIAGSAGLQDAPLSSGVANCERLGEVPHATLLAEMERASIFASPALYEPFGLAVLEAARAGCALLLSDIPSFRELWDGAAVFFDPRDADELARSLQSLCRDETHRVRLQHAAVARAARYALDKTVTEYRKLYDSLLAGAANATLAQHGEVMA